ncbi:Transcription factor TGA like domain [Dillenia turbinata]|uniref:Transcription factor TGA like domain n=1 Tax=Dillenia turbinata TaxID=194707 RepID=A0AAN8VJ64_9MAGN
MIHHHCPAYYQALDLATENDVAQLLFPGWRNSLEKPFLFIGDFHPYLFTNLLRSFLKDPDDSEEQYDFVNKPYRFAAAWRNASKNLMVKIEQIERGLRLMVPELNRVRVLQGEFLERVAIEWAALFLEALSQFLVGFRDSDLVSEFETCKMPLVIWANPPVELFINGAHLGSILVQQSAIKGQIEAFEYHVVNIFLGSDCFCSKCSVNVAKRYTQHSSDVRIWIPLHSSLSPATIKGINPDPPEEEYVHYTCRLYNSIYSQILVTFVETQDISST